MLIALKLKRLTDIIGHSSVGCARQPDKRGERTGCETLDEATESHQKSHK
jgi:hypothetical protein